jgi:heptosyltransferase-2
MMATLIKGLGFLLSRMPCSLIEYTTNILSVAFLKFPSKRRRTLISNLAHAFPDWSESKLIEVARESASRMIEMGVFSLTYPFLSAERLRHTVIYPEETERKLTQLRQSGSPVLFLLPHLCLLETVATSLFFRPGKGKTLGAIYRPNRNPAINEQIDRARKSTGLVTFSRKKGLLKAKKHLNDGNWLIVLFDQNAGDRGVLDLFFGRLISYTNLPSLLCRKSSAKPVFAFPKRVGFFQTKLELVDINCHSHDDIPKQAHNLLAEKIRQDPLGLPEWLWSHGKWKVQSRPESRFRISVKRDHLIANKNLPRKTSFCIRVPNWLGDVIMCLPLIKALRDGRPDARFTVITKSQFIPMLELFGVADDFIPLPETKGLSYFLDFRKNCKCLCECYLLFTNSLRGDLEALVSGSPQRFGMILPNRIRPLLSHSFDTVNIEREEISTLHQSRLWEKMMNHFGLTEKVCDEPFEIKDIDRDIMKIGVIPGSSNNPAKRWGVDNWLALISKLLVGRPNTKIFLYGTQEDLPLANDIANRGKPKSIVNMAGKTNLRELSFELASCGLVVGNDTGGMHLANALGTPVAVLYGPTNPLVTGPFFNSPKICIQPKECSLGAGTSIQSLSVNHVHNGVSEIFKG